MPLKMKAARLYGHDQPLRVDEIDIPALMPGDVLVRVRAAGIIPNMNNVFTNTHHAYPPLPAIVGLDCAGEVVEFGSAVEGFRPGDRVYVNPLLSCGHCRFCRAMRPSLCEYGALRGYIGFTPKSVGLMARTPCAAFAEYMVAEARYLVPLPDEISFAQAGRFGYLGTAYAALQLAEVKAGSWVVINGVTGTLGVAGVLWALGMGASRILGLGRNRAVLDQVKAIAPGRVAVLALGDQPAAKWIREQTDGHGAHAMIDCTGRGSDPAASVEVINGLQRGGIAVNVSALHSGMTIDPFRFMDDQLQYRGSNWFTVGQAEQMAELIHKGVVSFDRLTPVAFPLDQVNEALAEVKKRPGGLTNIVIAPHG